VGDKRVRLLRIEEEIVVLWKRYHRPNKASWEGEWAALEERVRSSNVPWLRTKQWGSHTVDYELSDEWIEKLNAYADVCGVRVITMCAGHPHGVSGFGAGAPFNPDFGVSCDVPGQAFFLASHFAVPGTSVVVQLDREAKRDHYGVFVKPLAMRRRLKSADRLAFSAVWWEEMLARFSVATERKERARGLVYVGDAILLTRDEI
jgi:hypothetical protein